MNRQTRGKGLLILLSAAHSLNHSFFWIASPILLLITTDLHTTNTTIGIIGTTGSLVYGFGSLLAGALADRTSEIRLIALSTGLAGLSSAAFLLAQNITTYAIIFISMCIWTGLYHPAANTLISRRYDAATGKAMGIHGAGGTIGIVFTPIISLAAGITLGWRASFVIFGAFAILTAALFKPDQRQETPRTSRAKLRELLTNRALWILLIFNFTVGLYMKSVELFLPTYLAEGPLNFLPQENALFWAGTLTTLMLLTGAIGQWLGGRQADVKGSRIVLITTSLAVLLGFLALAVTPPQFWFISVAVFTILYGLAFYGHQPALNSLAGSITPIERRGAVYGLLFFTGFGIGAISQAITGYISDLAGIVTAFHALSVFAGVAFVTSLFIADKRKNQETSHSQI